jgi:hypothetical protein
MVSTKRKSIFSSDELSVLQRAFDLACKDLRLSPDGVRPCEELGALIFDIAATGEADCMALRRESVRRFRRGPVVQPSEIEVGGVLPLFKGAKGDSPHPPRKR